MRYPGGKVRIGKRIAGLIGPIDVYIEPFCGMCSVAQYVQAQRKILNDANSEVIALWRALQSGWDPPETLTEEDYRRIKLDFDNPHLRALVGFGCSFAGKYFGGFARSSTGRNFCLEAKRGLLRRIAALRDAEFTCVDFASIQIPEGAVVYADPPYAGTTVAYGSTPPVTDFWPTVLKWSERATVYVSEYTCPFPMEPIWQIEKRQEMGLVHQRAGKTRVEKVWRFDKFTPNLPRAGTQ